MTFKYYSGVLAFLEEDYAAAEGHLTEAYTLCLSSAQRNIELVLMYLIPTMMLTRHRLPSKQMLQQSPTLERLFLPITTAIRAADLRAFNEALEKGEEEFVKRRIYLTLERGRDIILRNLFRKVFLAGGYEAPKDGEPGPGARRTRVPVKEFAAALQMAGAEVGDGEGGVDVDEVECLIANSIYKVSWYQVLATLWLSLNERRCCLPRQAAVCRQLQYADRRTLELHERLHCARSRDRRPRQE